MIRNYLISTTVILLLVPLILAILGARSLINDKTSNAMRYPQFFIALGIVGLGLVEFGITMSIIQGWERYRVVDIFIITIGGSLMSLLGCVLVLYAVNWRLVIDDDLIIHKNIWGITRKYQYSEITRICRYYTKKNKMLEKYLIYVSGHKITVDCFVSNFNGFEQQIKKGLKRARNSLKMEDKVSKL